jgi:WD40 repeat protein
MSPLCWAQVRVWSLLGVPIRRELPRHPDMVNELVISKDCTLVASVTENEGCLRLFSLVTGAVVSTIAAHMHRDCNGVALSDDASLVRLPCHVLRCAALAPRPLPPSLAGGGGDARVPCPMLQVSFDEASGSANLRGMAVTCADDSTIKLWDLDRPGGPALLRVRRRAA